MLLTLSSSSSSFLRRVSSITDRVALLSKGFHTWFRHGTLWYMDQNVRRECRKGEAIRLPHAQGCSPLSQGPSARVPARGPHGGRAAPLRPAGSTPRASPRGPRRATSNTLRDNGVTAPVPPSCLHPRPRSTAATSSYANVVGTAAMNTDAPAPGPAAPAADLDSTFPATPPGPHSGAPAMPSVHPASSLTQSAGPADPPHSQ